MSAGMSGAEVSFLIGQRVRHMDYKGQRVTGIVRGLEIDNDRGLLVTIMLDVPIVMPPFCEGDREISIHWQTGRAHEFSPFDERDEQVAGLVRSLDEILNLCAIGDVDENTEAYGWGGAVKRARAAIAQAIGAAA